MNEELFYYECCEGECIIYYKKPYPIDIEQESMYLVVVEIGYKSEYSESAYFHIAILNRTSHNIIMNKDYNIDFDKEFISDETLEECTRTGKLLIINGVEYCVIYNEGLDVYKLFEKDGDNTEWITVSKIDGIYLDSYGID